MADERTYIKVHDGLPDHPKIDALSDAAFRLLVSSWCWCSRYLTDGRIPAGTWARRGTRKARDELVASGLAEVVPSGIYMHDYLEHQRSADEVAALRAKRREAGKAGGKAKANALASARANAKQTASKNVAESETESDRSTKASASAAADAVFEQFWQAYPVKLGKQDARKAWDKATRQTDPALIIAGAERYRDDPNRDPAHSKWAQGWLNGGRWTDPIPSPVDQSVPEAWR